MDTLTTSINREYALRFLGVTVLFVALAGWFLYDGQIGYPQKNAAVAPVAAELATRALAPADWVNTAKTGTAPLTEAFRAAGLEPPTKVADTFTSWVRADDPRAMRPEEATRVLQQPLYSQEDIRAQFISAAVSLIAALGLLVIVAIRFRTRHMLDDDALTVVTPLGTRRYPLDTLQGLDDSQWAKRGICKVNFTSGRVTLDAWHHTGVRALVEKLKVASSPATVV